MRRATRQNADAGARGPILAGPRAARYTDGMDAPGNRRWYCPTPRWLVLGSLAVTGLIWLSDWLGWPAWHKGYAVLVAVAGVGVVLVVMLLWWLVALVFRWRFQFSLRSLLLLVVVVALPFSWLAAEMQQARRQGEAAAAIEKLQGIVFYDWQFDADGNLLPVAKPLGPIWTNNPLENHFFSDVVAVGWKVVPAREAIRPPATALQLRSP